MQTRDGLAFLALCDGDDHATGIAWEEWDRGSWMDTSGTSRGQGKGVVVCTSQSSEPERRPDTQHHRPVGWTGKALLKERPVGVVQRL